MELEPKDTALLVHIEHKRPIEVSDFISSLNALNNLYTAYVKKNGCPQTMSKSRLYVEKVKEGSIDVFLCEMLSATILPFAENANVIFEFAGYLKSVYEYFSKGLGKKPQLDAQECKHLIETLNVVTSDSGNEMTIGAVNKSDTGNVFNNCTFNFGEGSGTQRLIERETELLKETTPDGGSFPRVLMQIYQLRNEAGSTVGNKAIIDSVFKGKKLGVVFGSDELKDAILFPRDFNPTQKAFWVDVEVLLVNGKPKAYNVTALHDIIDIEEQE